MFRDGDRRQWPRRVSHKETKPSLSSFRYLEILSPLEIDMLVVEGVLNIKGRKSSIHLKDLVKSYGAGGPAKSKSEVPLTDKKGA